jgi:hypothetical protein
MPKAVATLAFGPKPRLFAHVMFLSLAAGCGGAATALNCDGLAEVECRSHVECTAVTASSLDERNCVSSDTFIECGSATAPSCQWGSSFRAPDGTCWATGGCPSKLPSGWQLDLSCGSEYMTARAACSGVNVDSGESAVDGGTDSSPVNDS